MRRKYFLILSLLFISTSLFSQTDFRKGYIITNDSDTTFGFIDYRNDYLNCNKCVFKKELSDETITYLPGEINSYRFFDSKYYISSFIDELGKDVFLEYLIDGIVDVYYYKYIDKTYYYISKEDSELYNLKSEKKEVYINGTNYIKTSNEYIGILRYLLSDSKLALDKINNMTLSHKSLINIATDYHHYVCEDEECVIFEKKLPPVRFEFSAFIFADYSNLGIKKADNYNAFNYQADVGYSFGIGLSTYLPRLNERISIYLHFLYDSDYYYSSYYSFESSFPTYNYAHIKINYINNKIGFKYKFPKGKVRPEFLVAWTNNFILESSLKRIREVEFPVGTVQTYYYTDDIFKSLYYGVSVGGGLNFLKLGKIDFNISLQYDYMLGGTQLNLNSTRLGLGVNF